MNDPEFESRFKGRFFGKYRGIVQNVADPKQYGRIKVKVPSVLGGAITGWAWPVPAYGGGINTGGFLPPEVDDLVWIEFEEGDKNRPIWQHGPWGKRGGDHNVNTHARGEADDDDLGYHGVGPLPPSQFAGTYGNVRYLRDPAGNALELDATEGAERAVLKHTSGSYLEIGPDGSVSIASSGNQSAYVVGNLHQQVVGKLTTEARVREDVTYGDHSEDVRGDKDVIVLGGVTYTVGSINCAVKGDEEHTVGGSVIYTAMANKSDAVLGSRNAHVSKADLLTILENAEWIVANATNVDPTSTTLLLHGYNGLVRLRATDATSLATVAQLQLDPATSTAVLYAGTPADEALKVLGSYLSVTPSGIIVSNPALIQLGSATSVDPAVLGTELLAFLSTIMLMLDTHTHATAVGPSSPPLPPLYTSTFNTAAPTLVSSKVFLE